MNTLPPLPAAVVLGTSKLGAVITGYTGKQVLDFACAYALAAIAAQAQPASGQVLIDLATGRIQHRNEGLCPDFAHESRDPDCPVCRAIDAAVQPVQPTPLQPLNRDRIARAAFDAGYRSATSQGRRDFICGILHGEQAHGIGSPGAHGSTTGADHV